MTHPQSSEEKEVTQRAERVPEIEKSKIGFNRTEHRVDNILKVK